MQISGSIRCWRRTSTAIASPGTALRAAPPEGGGRLEAARRRPSSLTLRFVLTEAHVLEVDGLVVDAARRAARSSSRTCPGSATRPISEATNARSFGDGSHCASCAVHSASDNTLPSGSMRALDSGPILRLNALCGAVEAHRQPRLLDDPVPALDAGHRVLDEVVAQLLVQRIERRRLDGRETAVAHFEHRIRRAGQQVIVADASSSSKRPLSPVV